MQILIYSSLYDIDSGDSKVHAQTVLMDINPKRFAKLSAIILNINSAN